MKTQNLFFVIVFNNFFFLIFIYGLFLTQILVALKQYLDQYHKRIADLENKKFDLEKEVEFKDMQVRIII